MYENRSVVSCGKMKLPFWFVFRAILAGIAFSALRRRSSTLAIVTTFLLKSKYFSLPTAVGTVAAAKPHMAAVTGALAALFAPSVLHLFLWLAMSLAIACCSEGLRKIAVAYALGSHMAGTFLYLIFGGSKSAVASLGPKILFERAVVAASFFIATSVTENLLGKLSSRKGILRCMVKNVNKAKNYSKERSSAISPA